MCSLTYLPIMSNNLFACSSPSPENSGCRRRRQRLLFDGLGLELRPDPFTAAYYTEFDLLEWARHNYGHKFAAYLQDHYRPIDILVRLAEESSIVLLSGGGFHGPEWSIRISLANLDDESYS